MSGGGGRWSQNVCQKLLCVGWTDDTLNRRKRNKNKAVFLCLYKLLHFILGSIISSHIIKPWEKKNNAQSVLQNLATSLHKITLTCSGGNMCWVNNSKIHYHHEESSLSIITIPVISFWYLHESASEYRSKTVNFQYGLPTWIFYAQLP